MPSPVALPDRPRWRRRRGRRPSPRHDATPFVDLAFVLLAAYVLVLLLGQPVKLEMNSPEGGGHRIDESQAVFIRATSDGMFWWSRFDQKPQTITLVAMQDSLRSVEQSLTQVVVLQVERGAPYRTAVDLLDELVQQRVYRYAIAPMHPRDLALIAEARAAR